MRNRKIITSPRPNKERASPKNNFVTVVILAENHGHRMKSYGPVSLVKIGDKTIIEKQVEAIRSAFPNVEIIVCAGFESHSIVEFVKTRFRGLNIRVVENQLYLNSNCCESARLCINNTMNNIVVLCAGNLLLNPSHLCAINIEKTCVLSHSNLGPSFEIGIVENGGRLENFSLGIKGKHWAEISCICGNRDINHFLSIVSNTDYKNRFMFEALNEMGRTCNISVLKSPRSIIKINDIKTLKEVML